MSTNFYATELPTVEKLKEAQKLLINQQINTVRDILSEIKTYHIGKRSSGWQFLFCPHVKTRKGFWDSGHIISPWDDKLKSILEYLSRKDVIIEDEYGKKYTFEEFWKEIEPCVYNDPENYINGEQFDIKQKEFYRFWLPSTDFEYTTDEGLRFATTNDFS